MTSADAFLSFALGITFVALLLGQILSMVRLLLGPTPGDRILALDTMVHQCAGVGRRCSAYVKACKSTLRFRC